MYDFYKCKWLFLTVRIGSGKLIERPLNTKEGTIEKSFGLDRIQTIFFFFSDRNYFKKRNLNGSGKKRIDLTSMRTCVVKGMFDEFLHPLEV